ncbi:unnamed protein product [Paramecium pentaurelia]|uniref:Uncharacterized protein n=1 Tax=Paramecium pentaurelia TaxID=43138 RepID=A0A8S1XKT0_9CILI|nr:unnamed protein product [Paramecium pentaurelia]
MNKIKAILFVLCIANARQYTLYKQCDSALANDQVQIQYAEQNGQFHLSP